MDLKHKQLLIFDFDGTLINSIPDITMAINQMLGHYKLGALTIEEVTPFIGDGAKVLVERALEAKMDKGAIAKSFFKEAYTVYFLAYKKLTCQETFLYPNVHETLVYLYERAYQLMICTNKPFDFIEPILEKLEIKTFFSHWIGEHSLETKKPDAAPLLYLSKLSNTPLDACVMIGDSKNDILAAKNAKMDSVGVSYGYNYNENIADYKPTVVMDDFSALKNIF